jgi:hypothetical protein
MSTATKDAPQLPHNSDLVIEAGKVKLDPPQRKFTTKEKKQQQIMVFVFGDPI